MRSVIGGFAGGLSVAFVLRLFMGQMGLFFLVPALVGAALGAGVAWLKFPRRATGIGLLLCLPVFPALVQLHLRVLAQAVPLPPHPEGKKVRYSMGGWTAPPFAEITYHTAVPFDEAAAFYRAELSRRGWTHDHCFDMGEYTSYTFVRGWSRYLILIWSESGEATRQVQVMRYYPVSGGLRMHEADCTPVTPVRISAGADSGGSGYGRAMTVAPAATLTGVTRWPSLTA